MKKILTFLSGAVAAHGFAALTGLLLTRWLSVGEYAIYTVLTVLIGAMTVLTVGGVNIAFSSIVGRVWPDRTRAAQALAASLRERRLLSILVLPPFMCTAAWLLYRAQAPLWLIAVLLVLLMIQWVLDMKSRIHDLLLLYAQRAVSLQMLDLVLSVLRLIVVVGLYLVNWLSVLAVIVVGVIGAATRVPFIQGWARREVPPTPVAPSQADQREIRKVTLRQFPVELFYCLQSQIALFILAFMAAPADTASFGALNRIAQLLVPVTMLVTAYAIPRFSQTRTAVFKAFFGWSLVGLLPGIALVLLAAWAPNLLLLLIGPNYANLQQEILIASVGNALGVFAATAWKLAANRGWNRWTLVQIPAFLLWCVLSPLFLDLSTLSGVLWFQLGFPIAQLAATCADLLAARRPEALPGTSVQRS